MAPIIKKGLKKNKNICNKSKAMEKIAKNTESENEESDDCFNSDTEQVNENENTSTLTSKKRKIADDNDKQHEEIKKKKLDSRFYKAPTVDEIKELKETENLFHSNLFRLQMEEVLSEVKIKYKYKELFNSWFEKLKNCINEIPETNETKFSEVKPEVDENIHIPMPNVSEETKGLYRFLKPGNIEIIGSFLYDTSIGPNFSVDIMIEMPIKLFKKRDNLNYVYMKKKAIYLAYIASSISPIIVEEKKFIGDNFRPILRVIPAGKLGKKVVVNIHASLEEDTFKMSNFLPEKNNVRPKWFFEKEDAEEDSLIPTPHYNSVITRDLVMKKNNLYAVSIIKEYPNLRDGIVLLKIWLTQRQMMHGYNGFNSHLITMYVLYLLHTKKLNTYMSSYMIVRNVWYNLAKENCTEQVLSFKQNSNEDYFEHIKQYDCVFIDITGYHNFAANLTKDTFLWVQQQAEIALNHLDNTQVNPFFNLFMKKVPFYRVFDQVICLRNSEVLNNIAKENSSDTILDYGADNRSLAIKKVIEVLKLGLGKRIQKYCVLPAEFQEWHCNEKPPNKISQVFIGLELNPDHCFSVVDKGPIANQPEAAEFRKFWGEKSELRRFQDSTIRESVVWGKGKSLCGKRIICKKIILHLLKEKLKFSNEDFICVGDQLEHVLTLKAIKVMTFAYGTGEEATLKVLESSTALEKELMALNDIPLTISGVQGSSPVFRYTEVFPPMANTYLTDKRLLPVDRYLSFGETINGHIPQYMPTIEMSIQLSASGKWPDELEAVRMTKAAFHIQIAECLRKQCDAIAQGNYSHIDVFKDGLVFRLKVVHPKEITLMKKETTEDGILMYRDTPESIELEKNLFEMPKLSTALHGLHSQQPSYGAACCLAKRWLCSQLLDDHYIPQLAVELLLAFIYLNPDPHRPAQLPQVAFLRFLAFCANEQWDTDPIIVNFNNEMTREEILAVGTLYAENRKSLPPLFISTPFDHNKSLWTQTAPNHMILKRISSLARESLRIFEANIFTNTLFDYKPLFRPPLNAYDCIIHVEPSANPRKLQSIDLGPDHKAMKIYPYKPHSMQKIPVVNFDPVQKYLEELRNAFSNFALFFHDTYGGSIIAVLLKPDALEPKDFKVANTKCCKVDKNGKLVLNTSAMVQDFYILGRGVVKDIQLIAKKRFAA